MTIKTIKIKIM